MTTEQEKINEQRGSKILLRELLVLRKYAHDYRDMKMTEQELLSMLLDVYDEIKKQSI